MIKFKVEGLQTVQAEIQRQIEAKLGIDIDQRMDRLLDAVIQNTPIDTGYARSRWREDTELAFKFSFSFLNPLFVRFVEERRVIKNDAPYIQRLNEGWSKQAPPRFIEQTILEQGFKPTQLI